MTVEEIRIQKDIQCQAQRFILEKVQLRLKNLTLSEKDNKNVQRVLNSFWNKLGHHRPIKGTYESIITK